MRHFGQLLHNLIQYVTNQGHVTAIKKNSGSKTKRYLSQGEVARNQYESMSGPITKFNSRSLAIGRFRPARNSADAF